MRPLRCALLLIGITEAFLSASAQAQTFTVLHSFTGENDGGEPQASLTLDGAGNLYGTASAGGAQQMGTVFKLTNRPSGWTLTTLHTFAGGDDGATPMGGVVFGPDGSLYGNSSGGGNPICNGGCGTVFNLKPPPQVCKSTECPWHETQLYQFSNGQDGGGPNGNLLFDAAGAIYGTTVASPGSVYELSPLTHGWMYHLLSSFTNLGGPYQPYGGVISDPAGNLFGTSWGGGGVDLCGGRGFESCGTVFELSSVGFSWHLNVLHSLQPADGGNPRAGLIFDRFGNLYGTTTSGTVFIMTPSGSNWTFSVLYQLQGSCAVQLGPYCGSWGSLAMDASGALYGTAIIYGAYGYGSVFKLTPSNGSWIYSDLHDFTNGADGGGPRAGVTLDANGNIYGTATGGGATGWGVVFEITP